MGLVGSTLRAFSPYHWGTGIGEVFKAKQENDFFQKFAKKSFFNLIAPYTALFLINTTVQVALSAVSLLPLFPGDLINYGINASIPQMVMNASSYVLFSALSASFFVGLSKNGMKENIKILMSPSKWLDAEYLFKVKEPVPVDEMKISRDNDQNTGTINMDSPKEAFDQSSSPVEQPQPSKFVADTQQSTTNVSPNSPRL